MKKPNVRPSDGWRKLRSQLLSERESRFDLATSEIAGPIQFTRNGGMYVWFTLGAQRWDFRTVADRITQWDAATYRWAALKGRTIKFRSTTRPYPAFQFARSLDQDTPEPLPQVPGALGWDDYLGWAQRRLQTTSLDQKLTMMGVWIGPNPKHSVRMDLVNGAEHPRVETVKVLNEIATVEKVMAGLGMNARVATAAEMSFLFHRSLSMGIPAPVHAGRGGQQMFPEDLAGLMERREWRYTPLNGTVRVLAENKGQTIERHVAVLTMGLMPKMNWPENGRDPWMLTTDKLSFPVEWSLSGAILETAKVSGQIEAEQLRAGAIQRHYAEHETPAPPAVARAIGEATQNLDEVTEGDSRTSARFFGQVRLATYAPTAEQALDQAREIVDHYGERYKMEVHHPRGQAAKLREFIPGEPWDTKGYTRRLPVRYLASAMPNVDSQLGTPTGGYLGYGIGSARRAIRFDGHYGPEVLNTPGLFPITAEPGGGKSVLIGSLAHMAVRRGEPTIILDPSGPLARLAQMPEFRPYSRVLDLTHSEAGTLSPYALIAEPRERDYAPEVVDGMTVEQAEKKAADEYKRAVARAQAERQQLMFDVLRMWLPPESLKNPRTDVLLRRTIRDVRTLVEAQGGRDSRTNPRWVITRLHDMAAGKDDLSGMLSDEHRHLMERRGPQTQEDREHAGSLAEELETAAHFPLGELIVPEHQNWIDEEVAEEKLFVVVTMPGLNPPPEGIDKAQWGSEERYTQPLLHLAAFYTTRFIYGRNRDQRKNVFLDENHLMGQWGSGRALFIRLSRDSRKWNSFIGAASQHPDDQLGIGRVNALMGGAFVGRLTNDETARRACQLLQCPVEYASVIQGLSPVPLDGLDGQDAEEVRRHGSAQTGEFILRDQLGRVGKMRVDIDWLPGLREALQTTPGRKRPPQPQEQQPAPFLDEELFDLIPLMPRAEEEDHDAAKEAA